MANYTKIVKGKLTAIKTDPENIILKAINHNVADGPDYGINGGFFYETSILSMAVNDFKPVKGNIGDYGSGWFNDKYARGTLVFDKMMRSYEVPILSTANDIPKHVVDKYASWGQGGISMSLQDDANWAAIAVTQHMPVQYGYTTRSGLVYDEDMNIWLVTSSSCTADTFRKLIKTTLGVNMVDGIFLDGGGSTQINCYATRIRGDGRSVLEMVALIDK
jgi:hypothetical protein